MSVYRAMGAFNGVLPEATGMVIGFLRDPAKAPYLNYCQLIPVPVEGNGLYRYATIEPDAPARMVNTEEFSWGLDDPRPSGEAFKPRIKWDSGQTKRYAFGYQLGERTQSGWQKGAKINPKAMYDRIRLGHASLHRSSRAVATLRATVWGASNTSDLQTLRGTGGSPAYWDESSGEERLVSGNPNPAFQIIKDTTNRVMRRLDLLTNGALGGEELAMVIGPKTAQAVAQSGEIVNYLKQQANARADLMVRNKKWGVPDEYNGWKIVVEDTPRVFIREKDDGSIADVVAGERDYIWNDDSVFFGSRPGGLDGGYGETNFSTFQMYYYGGLANVVGETDQWNQLIKGSIDIEDEFRVAAPISGFWLTGVLKP